MTERQQAILAAIIEQYAEIAAPVGSVTLAKLFWRVQRHDSQRNGQARGDGFY